MPRLLSLLALLLFCLASAGAPLPARAGGNPDAICDCESGFGACQHYLRMPGGVTADPCFCDRCREFSEHGGTKVPDGMSASCFQSNRVECYLKRHSVAWQLACSECAKNEKCCPNSHKENCPNCESPDGGAFSADVKAKAAQRAGAESRFFKKAGDVTVLFNKHFYLVSDVGGVKVKMRGGSFRLFNAHEYAHLMFERAEMARKEFAQVFGDRFHNTKPIGIFLPSKERDASALQATYFGAARTNQLFGGSDTGGPGDGMCFNGFCRSEQAASADDQLHVTVRHMIAHSLVSVWIRVDPNPRALPKWFFEGVAHWLSRSQDRYKDESTWCSQEGVKYSASGRGWDQDVAKIAADPKTDSIEKLFGKTAVGISDGQLGIDDQKRSWSYFDLCIREWRAPFVAMLEDIRNQKEIRDAFMQHMQCTPEIFDERWRARVLGRRRSMGPESDENELEANEPGARERRAIRNESDPRTLAAKLRSLGTIDQPKTVDVVLDQFGKNSELVRETAMVALLKIKDTECLDRIWNYGLSHRDPIVRAYAARASGRHKLEFAGPKLKVQVAEDKNWFARAEAAIACGELKIADAMSPMRKMVNGDSADKAQLAAMDGLAMFGEDAHMAVPLIVRQLESSQWQLRVAACDALGKIGSMEAVEPLVTRMERETGRVRDAIHAALKAITYDDLGRKPENWRAWWDREKAKVPNGLPKRPEKPAADAAKKQPEDPNKRYGDGPKYYGIEIYSSRIGFVLDTSLSMDQLFEPDPSAAAALSRTYNGSTKLAICKEEIAQVLKGLDPRSHFSIIVFNTKIQWWKKNPVPSSGGNISSAAGWMLSLPAAGETNYYDGLRAALDLPDGPDDSPDFKSTPDTLTFLTDGSPTQGEITDADTLLQWYTSLNRYARVRTHCITFGLKGVDLVLLRGMAEQNGGTFVIVPERN